MNVFCNESPARPCKRPTLLDFDDLNNLPLVNVLTFSYLITVCVCTIDFWEQVQRHHVLAYGYQWYLPLMNSAQPSALEYHFPFDWLTMICRTSIITGPRSRIKPNRYEPCQRACLCPHFHSLLSIPFSPGRLWIQMSLSTEETDALLERMGQIIYTNTCQDSVGFILYGILEPSSSWTY